MNVCDSHPVTRVGRAVAQGVVDSAYSHLTYALDHPGEAALDLGILLVAPELKATVALCRLAALAHHAYQHREEISAVARQFMDDIQNNAHHDPEWLAQNGYIFTHVLSDVFVVPQVSNKLMNTGSMRPLANGLKRQTEAVQACIRNGVNAAGQKACDGLKNILQNAGEALKTGNPQPAFAGMQNNASLRAVDDQANRAAHGLMKAAGDAAKKGTLNAAQQRGAEFEEFLVKKLGGKGSFKVTSKTAGTREFDGAVGNVWYEAKSGQYWDMLLSNPKKMGRFKEDMGRGLKIAKENGASYAVHSNVPIPQNIKDWLIKNNIPFTEW